MYKQNGTNVKMILMDQKFQCLQKNNRHKLNIEAAEKMCKKYNVRHE